MVEHLAVPTSPIHVPAKPAPSPVDMLLAASGSAFMGVFDPHRSGRDATTLRSAIGVAEHLLASAAMISDAMSEAVRPETSDAIGRQLDAFVSAWPNASRGDLAGYGLHLVLDVAERQPTRYALRSALRHLRQTSRFLPSIAEVLIALDDAQARIRNTAWHLRELPAALERARADLARAEALEARQARSAPELMP